MIPRFVKTDKYGCIDTKIMIPHHECYLIKNLACADYLFSELINGDLINLGKIECVCNKGCAGMEVKYG